MGGMSEEGDGAGDDEWPNAALLPEDDGWMSLSDC